jgi:hypothetical protein
MGVKSLSLDSACKQVAQIFRINDKNNNGKPVIRCSRCEGFVEKDRGKGFVVLSTATSKAREHIVVYCPGILPKENISDANLRHTLLINMSENQVSSMSKHGMALRKFDRLALDCNIAFLFIRVYKV